jgi:Na+/melibiose symporter-like transporter
MGKLSGQQIRFIDGCLERMGVEYVDIRQEMTDHIASALETQEGDFYYNLRVYVGRNKRDLLQQNKCFARIAIIKALTVFLKTLAKPLIFIAFVAMVLAISFAFKQYAGNTTRILMYTNYVLIVVFGVFASLYSRRMKFSGPEKLMRCIAVAHFIFLLLMFAVEEYVTEEITAAVAGRYLSAVFIAIILLAMLSFTGYQKKLKRQFIQ